MMRAGNILLVAYQCGPEMGSVSQIGWEWYARLCREHTVTLVTHIRNRTALEAAGAPFVGSEVIYIDTEWFAGPLYRLARRLFPRSEHSVFMLSSLDYFVFDLAAFRRLRRALRGGADWCVLHRVTPVTLAAPTWLGHLGLPTVIGPLNCGMQDPQGFGEITRKEATGMSRLRRLGHFLDNLLGSSRMASRILTASRATLASVSPWLRSRCEMMIENGVELGRFTPAPWPEAPDAGNPLKILFVGRLVPVKGLDMLIQAVERLCREGLPVQLEVVGDGPMRQDWEALSRAKGLTHNVRFVGALPLDAVAERMRACHVFCLPSVRESGGAVLLEAMACARPVIAVDFGGPGEIVDTHVGALLPLSNPQQLIDDLTTALESVFELPDSWRLRGLTGRRRVIERYSWPAKIAAADALYEEILEERGATC